jgi:hypothetical protein
VIKNEVNNVSVAVDKGEVSMKSGEVDKTISTGKQITVDQANNIKESTYMGSRIFLIAEVGSLIILGAVIYIKRKTFFHGKI